jgi:hypothetical protein
LSDDKERLLEVLEKVDKFYVYLAGIRENNILIVSSCEVPNEIEVKGQKYSIIHYTPEEYLSQVVEKEEEIFRNYKIYYFVKSYMRKILDMLACAEVERMSINMNDLDL